MGGRSSPPPSHKSASATTLPRPRKRIHPRQRRGEPRRPKPAGHAANGCEWLIGSEPRMETRRRTGRGQVHSHQWQLHGRGEVAQLCSAFFLSRSGLGRGGATPLRPWPRRAGGRGSVVAAASTRGPLQDKGPLPSDDAGHWNLALVSAYPGCSMSDRFSTAAIPDLFVVAK